MRLDADLLRYLTPGDMRVMLAIEARMRTSEMVPLMQLKGVCKNGVGELSHIISRLRTHTLVHQETGSYRLTYHGHDAIAIKQLKDIQKVLAALGAQMGCGKESDIFACQNEQGDDCVLKLHRLGRTSFRKGVKTGRDYIKDYKYNVNWLTMSTLSAKSEHKFLEILAGLKFRIPKVYGVNRHAIVMGAIPGKPLYHIKRGGLSNARLVLEECLRMVSRLLEEGWIHGDFNEFNLMLCEAEDLEECGTIVLTEEDDRLFNNELTEEEEEDEVICHHEKVVMYDFPQMLPSTHPNAQEYFDRDVDGIKKYFEQHGIVDVDWPKFEDHCPKTPSEEEDELSTDAGSEEAN